MEVVFSFIQPLYLKLQSLENNWFRPQIKLSAPSLYGLINQAPMKSNIKKPTITKANATNCIIQCLPFQSFSKDISNSN